MTILSIWAGVIVIVMTYNANLTSFLATSQTKLPFSTLEEVVAANDYVLSVYEGEFARNFLEVCNLT